MVSEERAQEQFPWWGGKAAFPRSRQVQSNDHGQRGPAKQLGAHNSGRNPRRPQRRRHTLDFLLMFCGGKAAGLHRCRHNDDAISDPRRIWNQMHTIATMVQRNA
jgi:hypothetical protein